jgi:hypothetical protein
MTLLRPLMGTRGQAQIDRALASYDPRPSAVLTDDTARAALRALASGESVKAVASHLGVSVRCIYDLHLGRSSTSRAGMTRKPRRAAFSAAGYQPPYASQPPSTATSLPVMKEASSEARKATTRAISVGSA